MLTVANKNLKLLQAVRESAIDIYDIIDVDEDWKLSKEKYGIKLFKYKGATLKSSEVFLKRSMDVDAPIDTVVTCMEDWKFQLDCNDRLKTLEVIEEIGPNSNIIYQLSKSSFIVSSREFVIGGSRITLKNEKVLLVNYSVPHKDYPLQKSVVRGSVKAIFLFEKISKKKTHVVNILNVDLKGSIPSIASNKMADMQYDSFAIIKAKIEKFYLAQ